MGVCNITLFLLVTVQLFNCQKPITIYSDFTKNNDIEFFKNTFPWIIDNLGSDIKLIYHFRDSGKKSGPRQCVLQQLNKNSYLQAEYLRCEATGHESSECIKNLPINTSKYNKCIKLKVNSFVKKAEREFKKIQTNSTPVILLPRKKIVVDVTPESVLNTICTLYSKMKPFGCSNPKPIPQIKTENKTTTDEVQKENKATIQGNSTTTTEKDDSEAKNIPKPKNENQSELNTKTNETEKSTNTPSTEMKNEKSTTVEEDTDTKKKDS